ncbi:hypothetical protein [Mycobacterium deserti]|uniref:Uncharacterized protein n=1 Tax=Mycobacterium deserti TaxID=2978347 RepID=A0ABT2M7T5_9MYCO|nr:hypothetical protein [Mycobacterium deserti]MCT7658333.1 hypothetical protein [Mycobacterium deserti]
MLERIKGEKNGTDGHFAVNSRVRVYPDTSDESRGVVVEDFGAMHAHAVDIGDEHFADPARRWAVMLDNGGLVFVDSHQLVTE